MKQRKLHRRKTRLIILDYLFWRFYCFFKNHQLYYKAENSTAAVIVILSCCYPISLLLILFTSYLFSFRERVIILCWIFILFIDAFIAALTYRRYTENTRILRNDYKKFRDKWGNESLKVRNLKKWLIILWLLVSFVGCHVIFLYEFGFRYPFLYR